ncbi:hypothetical protein MP638_005447 [Amoeboaphelidium occidentale]|nr:hypothetical protein MP638_005447 [Amoeboaphelidium occidentale]
MSTKQASQTATTAEQKAEEQNEKKLPTLGALEEDDEFEDFPAEDWEENENDKLDIKQWENNWDDDDVSDDFANQLRAEIQKAAAPQPMKH